LKKLNRVKWLNKEKTHSSEDAQVQGLKMSEKAENVQRNQVKRSRTTLKDHKKVWLLEGKTCVL